MITRRLTKTDVTEITKIHLKAFEGFFLSILGEGFLNFYYSCFLNDKNGFGIGVFDIDGTLAGFSVVTIHSKGFNRKLIINNFFKFLKIGIILLLTKPRALLRLLRNLTKGNSKTSTEDNGDYAELFSIGVDPHRQGLGIGKILLTEVEKSVCERGCHQITLTTDFFNNTKTIDFYKNMGYKVYYDFIAYPDRRMYKMIKTLN
jgi:ribosomal protein S18 acetylase RimI-like enzyme